MKTKDIFRVATYTICIMILIWFIISWIDVVSHNAVGDESYKYWIFNLFRIFEGRVQ